MTRSPVEFGQQGSGIFEEGVTKPDGMPRPEHVSGFPTRDTSFNAGGKATALHLRLVVEDQLRRGGGDLNDAFDPSGAMSHGQVVEAGWHIGQ